MDFDVTNVLYFICRRAASTSQFAMREFTAAKIELCIDSEHLCVIKSAFMKVGQLYQELFEHFFRSASSCLSEGH
jgi:hypothetical protein